MLAQNWYRPPPRDAAIGTPALSTALLGFMIAAIIAVAVIWNLFTNARSRIEQAAAHTLGADASIRAQQFEDFMSERVGDATLISRRTSIRALLSAATVPNDRRELTELAGQTTEQLRSVYGYRRVAIFDRDLRPVDGGPDNDLTSEEQDALKLAIELRRRQFVDLHQAKGGTLTFGLAQPIWTSAGSSAQLGGVAYLEFQAAQPIRRIFSYSTPSYRSERIALLRQSGASIGVIELSNGGNDDLVSETRRAADSTTIYSRALGAPYGTVVRGVGANATAVFGMASGVPSTPWVILVSAEEQEVTAPLQGVAEWLSALTAVVLVLMLGAFLVFRQRAKRAGDRREAALALRYSNVIRNMREGFLRLNADGIIVDVNAAAESITGWNEESLIGKPFDSLAVSKFSPSEGFESDHRHIDSYRSRWRRSDGQLVEIGGSKSPPDANGDICLVFRDITPVIAERLRLSRENGLHRLMHQSQLVIQRVSSRDELLREICREVQVEPHIVLVWTAWIDWDTRQLRFVEAVGSALGYYQGLRISVDPDAPDNHGPSGTAARERRVVIQADCQSPEPLAPWQVRAKKFGIRSSMSVPVIIAGRAVAMLCFYSDRVGHFDTDLTGLATEMGAAIAVAIEAASARESAKRLEEERSQNDARLRSIMQGAPVPLLVVDCTAGQMTFANVAFAKLFGESGTQDFDAWLDAVMVDPQERETMRECSRQFGEGATVSDDNLQLRVAHFRGLDGAIHTIQATLSRFRGNLTFAFVDISEEEQRTRDLLAENEKQRILFERSSDGILILSPDGVVLKANPATSRLFGCSIDRIVGTTTDQWSTRYRTVSDWQDATEHGLLEQVSEAQLRRADGDLIDVEAVWSKAEMPDGTRFFVVMRDITARKNSERELVSYRLLLEELVRTRTNAMEEANRNLTVAKEEADAANRAKSAFLASMSHEIRTPLNGVIGMSEILVKSLMPAEQVDAVRAIQESAVNLMGIIDDILDFSKIEAGRMELDIRDVELGDLIESACKAIAPVAKIRGVGLDIFISPGLPRRLRTDPTRLRQIMLNLLSNAVKFGAPAPGQSSVVELRVEAAAQDRFSVSITDHGIGMSEEVIGRLFTPFTQADAATTRRFGGTGLGLAIVKRLADIMRGEVSVRSSPGNGACFTVTLPLVPAEEHADSAGLSDVRGLASRFAVQVDAGEGALPQSPDIDAERAAGRLVLVAEDDAVNRKLIVRQLSLLGYAAETAENGLLALEAWRRGRFGLLLTDMFMPEMDGLQLAAAVRAEEKPNERIPIVALSANTLLGEAERAQQFGVDVYLTKPILLGELQTTLERIMPPAQSAVLDLSVLGRIVGDDIVMQNEILADFLQDDKLVARVAAAVAAGDAGDVASIAHRLKSSSRSVGALRLADCAAALERASREANWAVFSRLADQLRENYEEARKLIAAELALRAAKQ